ncbi:hypothetical protein ABPG75_010707 [Micractinium tetrahymenae]
MVEHVVIESKPLLPEGKPQAGISAAKDSWRVSAAWLPLAALFGALCTLAVASVALSGPNGWWLEFGDHRGGILPGATHLLPRTAGQHEPEAAIRAVLSQPQEGYQERFTAWEPAQQQQSKGASAQQADQQQQQQGRQQEKEQPPQSEQQQPRQQPGQGPGSLEAWAERLRVPWGPLLTQEEAARGLTYYGSGERLQRVAAKLLAGKPIKVFTLGASVTRGIGATKPGRSYPQRLFQFLNASFPHSGHEFYNRGIGGTSSGVYAVCAEQMVHEDGDIVILEFTINDAKDAPYTDSGRRGYEQLIRKLMALPGRPAILQLHHWAWWHAVGDGISDGGLFYYPPAEAQLSVFAQYYDFPVLSTRAAMWRLMQAREPLFNPDRQRYGEGGYSPTNVFIPAAEPGRLQDYWYRDRTHPGDEGHGTLAELLASALSRAVLEVLSPRPSPQLGAQGGGRAAATLGRDGLPPPMVPGNLAVPTSLCAIEEAFKDVVVAVDGFEYRPEKPNAPNFVEQKWGWTGREPGAWAELEFDTASGFQDPNDASGLGGPPAEVSLSFLRSYEGMGTADVACVSGCSCKAVTLDGTWEKRVSLQSILQFWVTRHPRCRVRVTISDRPGAVPQDGHKVSLTAVMVSHWAIRLNKYDEQVEKMNEVINHR